MRSTNMRETIIGNNSITPPTANSNSNSNNNFPSTSTAVNEPAPRPASAAEELRMKVMASMKKNKGDELAGSPHADLTVATTPGSNGERERTNRGGTPSASSNGFGAAVDALLAQGRAESAQNQLAQQQALQQAASKDSQADVFESYNQSSSTGTERPMLNVRITSDYEPQDEKLRSATSTTTGLTGGGSAQSATATPSTTLTARTNESERIINNKSENSRIYEKNNSSQPEKHRERGRSPLREHRGYDSYRQKPFPDERFDKRDMPPHTRPRTPSKGRYDDRPPRHDDRPRESRYDDRIISERNDDGRGKRYQSPPPLPPLGRSSRDHPIDQLARVHPDDDRYPPPPPPSGEYDRMAVAASSARDLRDPYAHLRHPAESAALRERTAYAHDYLASYPPYTAPRDAGMVVPHVSAAVREADYAASHFHDVSDWLELTRFHDISYRAAKLQAYREIRRMDQEDALRAAYGARGLPPPPVTRGEESLLSRSARSSSALAMPPPPPVVQRDERLRERQPLPPQDRIERAPSRAAPRYEEELSSPYRDRDGGANQGRSLKRRLSFESDGYLQGRPTEKAQRSAYEDARIPPPPPPGSTPRNIEPSSSRLPLSETERKDSIGINGDRNVDGPPPARSFPGLDSVAPLPRSSLPPQEELLARSRNGSVPPSSHNQRRRYDENERGRTNDGPNLNVIMVEAFDDVISSICTRTYKNLFKQKLQVQIDNYHLFPITNQQDLKSSL